MLCTSCRGGQLRADKLDELFPCHTCENCGGNWIHLHEYVRWLGQNPNPDFVCDNDTGVQPEDTKTALLCPETGAIMTKYRISKDTDHKIDYSPSVNGIWLHKGEWELLKREGLAGHLSQIFTAPWQKRIREEQTMENFDSHYREQFGDEAYDKIRAVRVWLENHPQRADLIAFLAADDPYSAER